MSPSAVRNSTANNRFEDDLSLSIVGLGVEYPPFSLGPEALETIAARYYPDSTALKKVLSINRFTGIESRAAVGTVDHPIANQPNPPTITQLDDFFRKEGVQLSVNACRKAIKEWGGSVDEITHVVSTTCTNSANPGFDHYVIKELGIKNSVQKVLLHGVGCSGGLAAIRTAANLALGSSYRQIPARVLVLACEISSVLVRSELESIDKDQTVRIGVCLFSDCASSVVLSNGIGDHVGSEAIYDLLGWKHVVLEDTEKDLGFDIDPLGWKVVLSPHVPSLAADAVSPAFQDLMKSLPELHKGGKPPAASDFDWALHPGGSTIITGVEQAMNLTPEHMRASYEIYMNYGNSSSATVISVMDKLRRMGEGRANVVACAFGPGITLEMMVLRRPSALQDLPTETLD
ncbi:MAG: chalcone synthase [Lasallia pustulata]|uniref:Chalcone synthase n=1 Tax=Lasallia pustulata TaxID=136370 RepID=A0A5M8PS23_9LECA|nr:MAG: chalcone synthase [Lasallia pustulata]